MTSKKFIASFFRIALGGLLVLVGFLPAFADAESAQIVSAPSSGSVNPGTVVTFAVSSSGFMDPKYSVSDSFSGTGATSGSIDVTGFYTWTPTIYDAGKHTLTVTVADSQNHSASTTATILVGGSSAVLSKPSPGPAIAVGRTVSFSTATPGMTSPNFSVYDSSPMSSISNANIDSSGAFSWTPATDDIGVHALTVVASDPYGHSAQSKQSITVINPVIAIKSLQPGSAASVGSTVSFAVDAGALASSTFAVSDSFNGTSTVPMGAISSPNVFSWLPVSADIGLHTLTVTATDPYGNAASTTLTIVVSAATSAPSALSPATATPSTAAATETAPTAVAAASPMTPKSKFVFTTALAIGSRGTAVTELQKRLLALGFFSGTATGYYGTATASSVKQFQSAHGLARVGSVGPATRALLNKN